MMEKYGNNWPLLSGYAFRTGVFTGSLNRKALDILTKDQVLTGLGLIIDATSAYEDCAYVKECTDDAFKIATIMTLIAVIRTHHRTLLSLSYDRTERRSGLSALESEWKLFRLCLENQSRDEEADASRSRSRSRSPARSARTGS